jgi:nitrate/nitrite-specific signal transduction histidine kinase
MLKSIRGRLTLTFIALATGPLLIAGIILFWQSYTLLQQKTLALQEETAMRAAILTLILLVVTAVLASIVSVRVAHQIIQPIQAITETAAAFGAGDLTSRPLTASNDEIGMLAGTFNSMFRQLRDRIGTLEHLSSAQTKALATFREVSRLSAMLDEKHLVSEVIDRIQNSFHFYHANIFLFDESCENLILAGGIGETNQKGLADGNNLPRGQGTVGLAAESNAPVRVDDTSRIPGWKPNPLWPKTKSEVAVPISVGDQVLGVLDVQQNLANGFSQTDITMLQSIAHQLALAMRNARLWTPDRQQAEREALIASIQQKIQETTSIEDALRIAVSELGRALKAREARIVVSRAPFLDPAEAGFEPDHGR